MTALVLHIGNTTILELQDLTNSVTAAAVTNATVTVTLKDASGVDVVGQTWPATLSHVANGTYRATIEDDITLTENRKYTAIIDATVSGVGVAHWETTVIPQVRQ